MTKQEYYAAHNALRVNRTFGETIQPAFRGGLNACKAAAEAGSPACWLERTINGKTISRALYGITYAAAAQAIADNY